MGWLAIIEQLRNPILTKRLAILRNHVLYLQLNNVQDIYPQVLSRNISM